MHLNGENNQIIINGKHCINGQMDGRLFVCSLPKADSGGYAQGHGFEDKADSM